MFWGVVVLDNWAKVWQKIASFFLLFFKNPQEIPIFSVLREIRVQISWFKNDSLSLVKVYIMSYSESLFQKGKKFI